MRTTIEIDDKLMRDVLRATGLKTKREAAEQGLRTLRRLSKQEQIRRYRANIDDNSEADDRFSVVCQHLRKADHTKRWSAPPG